MNYLELVKWGESIMRIVSVWHLMRLAGVGPNPLRTEVVEGAPDMLPQVGTSLRFFSKPLTEGASLRVITTSRVVEVWQALSHTYIVTTLNSTYLLHKVGEGKE